MLKHGLISLDIAPEVSSIDRTASYRIGNISVPGFVVRRAHTSVDLKSGQSFMIAGLLQSSNDVDTERLPGIRKIPVLGALLSSKAYQRHETDLVILVTPYLVKPVDPTVKLRSPADTTKPPSNLDYLLGDTEEVRTVAAPRARPDRPPATISTCRRTDHDQVRDTFAWRCSPLLASCGVHQRRRDADRRRHAVRRRCDRGQHRAADGRSLAVRRAADQAEGSRRARLERRCRHCRDRGTAGSTVSGSD